MVQAQALLKPDEALVLFLALDDRSYVFAVTRESAAMQEIPLRGQELSDRVTALRKGLFNGAPDAAATPFDLEASHDLYAALFGGIENWVAKKPKLLVVPERLVDQPAVPGAGHPQTRRRGRARPIDTRRRHG